VGRDAVHRHPVQPGGAAKIAVGLLTALAALAVARAAHDPVTTKVTFEREVRGILQARCATCHSKGGPAPMPLATYDEVRPWARAVKTQVLTRRMPLWSAVHGYGTFANDPSLTPVEMAVVAAWVDGGQPKGVAAPPAASTRTTASPASGANIAAGAGMVRFVVPAAGAEGSVRTSLRWIAGWDFEPGDPLITTATLTSADGTPIATWVAGDAPVELPPGTGLHLTSPIHVQVQRRRAADYEAPSPARPSTLKLLPLSAPPDRRVWIEETACGTPRAGRAADLLAVRPLLANGGSARLWLERPGAPQIIVGWFRDADARYPRTFWLARPAELTPESRLASDDGCMAELTLLSARR
jgi:mono/diheme cytochrome c family protein